MIRRVANTRFEGYDVDLFLWGTIVPVAEEDRSSQPWLWDRWGVGPRGQRQQPFLDIGASGLYVRKFWATQLYVEENYTSGLESNLHGGFLTQVSGLYPLESFHLATKGYVDDLIGGGVATSLSGLTDVYDGPWTSGYAVVWDGIQFVPSLISGALGTTSTSGHFELQFTATSSYEVTHNLGSYPQVEVLNSGLDQIHVCVTHLSNSGLLLEFNGNITNGWVICDTTSGLVGSSTTTIISGGSGATNFSGLSDVADTGWTSGLVARYDGLNWQPIDLNTIYGQLNTNNYWTGYQTISGTGTEAADYDRLKVGGYVSFAGWTPWVHPINGNPYAPYIELSGTGALWTGEGNSVAWTLALWSGVGQNSTWRALWEIYDDGTMYALDSFPWEGIDPVDNKGEYTRVLTRGRAGDFLEGSGIFAGADYRLHIDQGWGITVSESGLSANTTNLDTRYALSGTVGGSGATSFSGLSDVTGTYTSGTIASFNGTNWTPLVSLGTTYNIDYPNPNLTFWFKDEFEDSSLSGVWTEWDQDNSLTVTEDVAGLKFVQIAANTGNRFAGITQAVPAGSTDFTVYAKLGLFPINNQGGDRFEIGLFVGSGMRTIPATGPFATARVEYLPHVSIDNYRLATARWTHYSGTATNGPYWDWGQPSDSTVSGTLATNTWFVRMRVFRGATNIMHMDIGSHGVAWHNISNIGFNGVFTPTDWGICCNNNMGSSFSGITRCYWTRVVDGTAAFDQTPIGARVRGWA